MYYKLADPSDIKGSILIDNKLYKGDFLEGVSIMDLLEQRDKSFALIFAYIKISKTEAEQIMNMLLYENVMKEIGILNGEVRYGIVDETFRSYVQDWGSLHNEIVSSMFKLWRTVRGHQVKQLKSIGMKSIMVRRMY
jgi:hypothetical protein